MTKLWTPPRMWSGETVFIIGGGPSLSSMDLSPIHKRKSIGANCAYLLGNWIDIIIFGDHNFHRDNLPHCMEHYKGLICTCCTKYYSPPLLNHPRIKVLVRGSYGLESKPGKISWNNSTGAAAVSLAYILGAKKIVLLGFDMHRDDNGNNNFHDHHKGQGPTSQEVYDRHIRGFEHIKNSKKVEIVNATPDSSMTLFPMVNLEETL